MKPPPRVQVGARTYALIVDSKRAEVHDALGAHMGKYEEIVLNPAQGEQTMRETVAHELIHAMFFDAAGPTADDEAEEKVCVTLAPRLLDVLRRNPRLVTYLTAP